MEFTTDADGNKYIGNPNIPTIDGGENIRVGQNPPDPKKHTPGFINILYEDGGPGYHGEEVKDNEIVWDGILFNTGGPHRDTYLQELTQVLGPRADDDLKIFGSKGSVLCVNPFETAEKYQPTDLKLGKFIYTREIGNTPTDKKQANN